MKNLIWVVLITLLLGGCNGSLTVKLTLLQDVVFKDYWNSNYKLNAGEHEIELTVNHKKKHITFTIEDADGGSGDPDEPNGPNPSTDIRFTFENESQVPKENGPINLPSSVSGQPVNLAGQLTTDIQKSDLIRGVESCRRLVKERVCSGDPVHCRWERVWAEGEKEVEFHRVTKTIHIVVNLLNTNGKGAPLGGFDKTAKRNYRDYIYEGVCHIYGRRRY